MFVIKDTKKNQQMRKQIFVVNSRKRAIKVIKLVQIHVSINNHTVMALGTCKRYFLCIICKALL